MLETAHLLKPSRFPKITRAELQTLQVNLGFRCNLSCVHCHVSAGPNRTEEMSRETIQDVSLAENDVVYVPPTVLAWVGYQIQSLLFPARSAVSLAGVPGGAAGGF